MRVTREATQNQESQCPNPSGSTSSAALTAPTTQGNTDDLGLRVAKHQSGEVKGYTETRLPVELAFAQECARREEALAAELRIKGWSRKKKEAMIQGDWNEVHRLARGKMSVNE